ncbi:VWA domain-containing protein [Enterovirga rhinocerotis]|uniref:Ca-activated chloride channel family protein n=1 Tax=Enterovirga rhinocerotis TaxID=1339210 RepID=A0A4R7BVM5_9HYPH|nr:VWA domain-containing protein [Enterovirga rhinocerotis]TDR89918.1 Ca-activated chloride channel family protein [Enterovirga rhinocerotis]
MTAEFRLDRLETPAPSREARDRAVSAALQRFDRHYPGRAATGRVAADRGQATSPRRRFVIRRHQAALAASLAILIGGPLTYMVARDDRPAEQAVEAEVSKPAQVRTAEAPAPEVVIPPPDAAGPTVVPPAEPTTPAAEPRGATADAAAPPPPTTAAPAPKLARPSPVLTRQMPHVVHRERLYAPEMRMAQGSAQGGAALMERPPVVPEPQGRDQFAGAAENGFKTAKDQPVSTFSIDVDTASYSFARASLGRNVLPPPASVRTEELINYFPYAYPAPASPSEPFRTDIAVFPSPWTEGRKLVRIGIKGYAVQKAERPRANLVFLVDTSGSMNAPNRLPLVKQSLAMLLDQLDGRDRVAIVTYSGSAGTALEPTPASEKAKILAVIDGLGAGGSTAGGEGIRQAYSLAERSFDKEAVNRVVLATDGDFNVGIRSRDELKGFVERERGKGIFLSILGFGMGNYNDALMQSLAQNGNGTAAYIDTIAEARKVLVEEATSTLIPIAKDVKIQVEFNPATVQEYRLVGYETRLLAREDFNNDKVDAGDVGSGQSVTALYEIVPAGGAGSVAALRYGAEAAPAASGAPAAGSDAKAEEYGFVKIRYKLPNADTSTLISTPIGKAGEAARFEDAPQEARFATAVAGFGEILRGGRHTGRLTLDDVVRIAQGAKGDDPYGYRAEFVNLARAAKTASSLPAQRR